MIKLVLISLLIFLLIFLLIKFFKNTNLKIRYLFIFFIIGVIIYFIYTGKIGPLLSLSKILNLFKPILNLLGI